MTRRGGKVPVSIALLLMAGCGGGPAVTVRAIDRDGWVYRVKVEGRTARPIDDETLAKCARQMVCSQFIVVDKGEDMDSDIGSGGPHVGGMPYNMYEPYIDIRCETEPRVR